MHFHLPKPLHGWREFLGEVGIIVIGVLLALTAEQIVDAWHWRNEAREFRRAVDEEVALNLGYYAFDQMQAKCATQKLGELQKVLQRSRDGQPVKLAAGIGQPLDPDQSFSVWDSKDPQAFARLPLDIRLQYAKLYELFRATEGIAQAQNETWKKMAVVEEPGPLTLEDRRELRALVDDAGGLRFALSGNWTDVVQKAASLGIRPEMEPWEKEMARGIPKSMLCQPILIGSKN
jgi:hypothetical protein